MRQVQLRRYTVDHAPLLFEAARESVAQVYPWIPWCHPGYEQVESVSWITSQIELFDKGAEFQFAVESDRGVFLGGCGLNAIDAFNQVANLGYWIRTAEAGRGFATQAVRALSGWAFLNTELVRLEILAAAGNIPSQRVAKSAGAVREGLLRKRLHLHGVWHDAELFSIIRAGEPAA